MTPKQNLDPRVVRDFGQEWQAFNQNDLTGDDLYRAFDEYFHVFPWANLPPQAHGFDMGCGSGRWAQLVAPRVGHLTCIDPSDLALHQARQKLAGLDNVTFEVTSVDGSTLPAASQDFGYCLGVLHHIPDTLAGLKNCTEKLKPGAPFLLYLYYRFDHRPWWFKAIWRMTDLARRIISRLPFRLKWVVSQVIAACVYWPLARLAAWGDARGMKVDHWPLSTYRDKPFYFLRTDALDRFGTRLEKRFTKLEIETMMQAAGLTDIRFSDRAPFWVAVGFKAS